VSWAQSGPWAAPPLPGDQHGVPMVRGEPLLVIPDSGGQAHKVEEGGEGAGIGVAVVGVVALGPRGCDLDRTMSLVGNRRTTIAPCIALHSGKPDRRENPANKNAFKKDTKNRACALTTHLIE